MCCNLSKGYRTPEDLVSNPGGLCAQMDLSLNTVTYDFAAGDAAAFGLYPQTSGDRTYHNKLKIKGIPSSTLPKQAYICEKDGTPSLDDHNS